MHSASIFRVNLIQPQCNALSFWQFVFERLIYLVITSFSHIVRERKALKYIQWVYFINRQWQYESLKIWKCKTLFLFKVCHWLTQNTGHRSYPYRFGQEDTFLTSKNLADPPPHILMFILLATLIDGRHNQSHGAIINTLAEVNSSCIHHSNIWKFPGSQGRGKQRKSLAGWANSTCCAAIWIHGDLGTPLATLRLSVANGLGNIVAHDVTLLHTM